MYLVVFAGVVGLLPTVSMLFTAVFGASWQLNAVVEASAQNYCAGLILGAVSTELFPIISDNLEWQCRLPGITCGFILSLLFISSLDFVVNSIEDAYQNNNNETPTILQLFASMNTAAGKGKEDKDKDKDKDKDQGGAESSSKKNSNGSYYQALGQIENGLELGTLGGTPGKAVTTSREGSASARDEEESSEDSSLGDVPLIQLAFQATRSPFHRDMIRNKVQELVSFIQNIQDKSRRMLASQQTMSTNGLNVKNIKRRSSQDTKNATKMIEIYADEIDQDIHQLQYVLDHCRRILQGAGSDIDGVVPRIFIDEDGGKQLTDTLSTLNYYVESINEILHQDPLSKHAIKDIHRMMDHMDKQIDELHDTVEDYNFKWKKRTKITNRAPIPQTGSFVPLGFLIPVIVDSLVDGFFMGATCAISKRAGIILGVSNCLEMGFLGLAVSIRVNKCTGSSAAMRWFALLFPPLVMLTAAVVGALVGTVLKAYPTVFVGFISFGIVALLSLVVNELLVEARKTQEENERWWSGMVVFIGIYSVILMGMLPGLDVV